MERKIPIQNIYYMLCYSWDSLEEKDIVQVSDIENTELIDLFAKVLIGGTNDLIRRGFDRKYLCVNDELSVIKGKINFNNTYKKRLLQKGKISAEFDDLSHNILHNQIIKTTIKHLINCEELNYELKDRLTGLYKYFRDIDEIRLNSKVFKNVILHRNNQYYKFLMNICEIVYENLLIDEKTGDLKFQDFERDEKKMWKLFQNFVYNFYKREQKVFSVRRENIYWNDELKRSYDAKFLPKMETDITLFSNTKKIIIDTKYSKTTLSDHKKVKSENLYQLFSYLKNVEIKGGINKCCEGMLLYPQIEESFDLEYHIQGHRILIKTVDLNQDWKLIYRRLLAIIGVDKQI